MEMIYFLKVAILNLVYLIQLAASKAFIDFMEVFPTLPIVTNILRQNLKQNVEVKQESSLDK